MTRTYTVAVLVGSLRKVSFTRRLAEAMVKLSPTNLRFEVVEIGQLPLYNQDLDDNGAPCNVPTEDRYRSRRASRHSGI